MKRPIFFVVIIAAFWPGMLFGQDHPRLTVEKIMQDPDQWIGTLPRLATWSADSKSFYFEWKKDSNGIVQEYKATIDQIKPILLDDKEKKNRIPLFGIYNRNRDKELYSKDGNLYIYDFRSGTQRQLTFTLDNERPLRFSYPDTAVFFQQGNNVFVLTLDNGFIRQLTDIRQGKKPEGQEPSLNKDEEWLHEQQLYLFQVLKERKKKDSVRKREREKNQEPKPKTIYTGNHSPAQFTVSPDGKYITWLVYHRPANAKHTEIPHFVTESGYTEIQKARTKVGSPYFTGVDLYIYNRIVDTVIRADVKDIPGLHDIPEFWKDYPGRDTSGYTRGVSFSAPQWSWDDEAFVDISSLDYKDRWLMVLDPDTGHLKLIDRQHDDAWIGGPGIGWWGSNSGWMPDNRHIWFQSERSGYSHLYLADIQTGKIKALTRGKYEIYNPALSRNGEYWYFSSNEKDPGERHFYRMDRDGKNKIRLTNMPGRNDVSLSPDEKYMVIRHSYANQPWELFLKETSPEAKARQVTFSLTGQFQAYPWRIPEFITFKARDGEKVPARLYLPQKTSPGNPAVIFVHGAGYLQNAHKWWSSYFREYMFHNLLVDLGYIVLDMDYRGSAGYGRDWRTAIYRHMGGKDLDDQVDGARFLVSKYNVDPKKIGIYGGSYGGFITLMALFTQPDVFKAGAALRPVTDWAHYNHGYTAEILNTPVEDSIAYVRSSPIYFAEGLSSHLLICHGMVDDNVHFQDVVRLSQRLIELGKDNWELAVYPLERHGFVEPSSWTDEYNRILKLFETTLK